MSLSGKAGDSTVIVETGDGNLDHYTLVHTGHEGDDNWHVEDSDAEIWAKLEAKVALNVLNKL